MKPKGVFRQKYHLARPLDDQPQFHIPNTAVMRYDTKGCDTQGVKELTSVGIIDRQISDRELLVSDLHTILA